MGMVTQEVPHEAQDTDQIIPT